MMIDLRQGDCVEVMDNLISEGVTVNAIIADPPYGTTACRWDSVIPFQPMWERLNKLIKPNGAIALFGSEPFSSALRMSNIKNYKYDWVWDKGVGVNFMNVKREPMKVNELVSVFGRKIKYYPQKTKRDKPIRKTNNVAGESSGYKLEADKYVGKIYTDKYPTTILSFSSRSGKRGLHPTQKPVALLEYLVKTYTGKGETVLDFTMGSGTTIIACQNTGRNGIGIELDGSYFKIAEKRINENLQDNRSKKKGGEDE